MARVLILCDWLPPDFGAVGQYAIGSARKLAGEGNAVTLVGFSSTEGSEVEQACGAGSLVVRKVPRPPYDRANFLARARWTLGANLALLWASRRDLRLADEVRFSGSPPYMLHFVMPVATLLRVRTRYRITDFHPECLVATLARTPLWLKPIVVMTRFWRRRVDVIEVLGEDQRRRLAESRVDPSKIELLRDPSPVNVSPRTRPASAPQALAGRRIVLYSGNWGIAHDHKTFVAGFALYCASHPSEAGLWINATGKRAAAVERACAEQGLPFARTNLVPLHELAGVLAVADVHLITLLDAFVGYVLPSKVYACIESGKPILFVGSAQSDVHLLCAAQVPASKYRRVDVGDAEGVARALQELLASCGAREPVMVSERFGGDIR